MTMIHRKLMAVTALILFLGCIALAPAHKSVWTAQDARLLLALLTIE